MRVIQANGQETPSVVKYHRQVAWAGRVAQMLNAVCKDPGKALPNATFGRSRHSYSGVPV